ncbi:hypothetical protein [Salipaludibacillus sp. CF4.18]|uniref:hypothetical protein n=1 Tax=Salipaludibacillus sp. CF4.18 TaxID=3373081 RepID=UPI003EE70D72
MFIDKDYNGRSFEMDEAYFADELLPNKTKEEDIREELKGNQDNTLEISIDRKETDHRTGSFIFALLFEASKKSS